jgi:hypothetical protein
VKQSIEEGFRLQAEELGDHDIDPVQLGGIVSEDLVLECIQMPSSRAKLQKTRQSDRT